MSVAFLVIGVEKVCYVLLFLFLSFGGFPLSSPQKVNNRKRKLLQSIFKAAVSSKENLRCCKRCSIRVQVDLHLIKDLNNFHLILIIYRCHHKQNRSPQCPYIFWKSTSAVCGIITGLRSKGKAQQSMSVLTWFSHAQLEVNILHASYMLLWTCEMKSDISEIKMKDVNYFALLVSLQWSLWWDWSFCLQNCLHNLPFAHIYYRAINENCLYSV